jgi:hypothetical protein
MGQGFFNNTSTQAFVVIIKHHGLPRRDCALGLLKSDAALFLAADSHCTGLQCLLVPNACRAGQ